MAEALLSASLQLLFERLASQEVANFILRRKLSQELLNDLKRKFLVVLTVLNDAEVKQFSNDLVKQWLIQVKDAVYDAEDLLDEIATDALCRQIEAAEDSQTGSRTHRAWNKFSDRVKAPFATQSMESRVKKMMARLEAIAQEKDGLGLKEGGGEQPRSRSPSTSLVDESFVYGRDDIKEEMVQWLLSDNEDINIDVICIVGMGGAGKTTLAQLLYNHDKVKEHFHMKAWVCVSTEFNLVGVTKSILEAIGCRPTSDGNLDLLQHQLKENLHNKKFLLVLDDIWDVESLNWESSERLRAPLLGVVKGSKIVVTSRDDSVAKTMRSVYTHRLGELSPQHCWSLFEKIAFQERDPIACRELEPIGRHIVDKCQGLPLAVKSLGYLLHSKVEKREWEDVLDSEIWHLQSGYGILPSVILSYHHLSPPVKRCFAYCSIFPQDHQFNKEELILLWMAEGLLHPQQNLQERRIEKIGELYFNELLAKSFFQKSIRGEESCFVMHDLIHELAQHVFGDFCIRVDNVDKAKKVSEKARHFLYFQGNYDVCVAFNKFDAFVKAKSMRTFLDVKPSTWLPFYLLSKRVLQDILPNMRSLCVLSLREYQIRDLPKSIGNLKHLCYLDLSYTSIKILPESVCCLYNLQTMILRGCEDLTELPSRMGKLINLRYLDLSRCDSLKEMSTHHGIGRLKNLQRLTHFVVGQKSGSRMEELKELSEIRGTLHISNVKNAMSVNDALHANMKGKSQLDELILNWESGWRTNGLGIIQQHDATIDDILDKLQPHPNLKRLSIINYPGVRFPNWFGDTSVLNNLVSLELRGCGNCSTLPPVGQLTHLKCLEISSMARVEHVGSEFYGTAFFQSLEKLSFEDMQNWEKWLCCGELFPHLQKLSMRACPKLTGKLPEHLLSLEELEIYKCPHLLVASVTIPVIRNLKMVDFGKLQLQMLDYDFTALKTSEIEISDVSQWKQLPGAPHQLSIRGCDSVESLLEEEILQTNIHDLAIHDCSFSRSMQKVGLPTTLKLLTISTCSKLEFLLPELFRCHLPVLERLNIREGVMDDSRPLFLSLGIFPKLSVFRIEGLKGLEKVSISISEGDLTSLRELNLSNIPNLETIELGPLVLKNFLIRGCSKLRSLALTHSSVEVLLLWDCPELMFQIEILPCKLRELYIGNNTQLTLQVEWGLQRLTSLTNFTIHGRCEDMELFPKECLLPSSLTSLSICNFPNLKSLHSGGLQQLTSLEELHISECPKLQFLTEASLQHLISLKYLEILGCPMLQSLAKEGLQHLISLKYLEISECPMLQSLAKEGLQHLTSLQRLLIRNCPKLKYLTKQRLPPSLSFMSVQNCPLLEKRCQLEKGEEWPYISHVPKIKINYVLL